MREKKEPVSSLSGYYRWPLLIAALVIVWSGTWYFLSEDRNIMIVVTALLVAAVCALIFFLGKKQVLRSMTAFSDSYDSTRKRILRDLTAPAALLDLSGDIIWQNNAFSDILPGDQSCRNILQVFPDITKEMLMPSEELAVVHSSQGDRRYRVEMQWGPFMAESLRGKDMPAEAAKEVILVCLSDETELLEYKNLYLDNRSCQGIVALDNYDEALGTVDEVKRSLLTALVDRKLSNYFGSMGGIIKKFEVDKYLLFMKDGDMSFVLEDRFSVLDDVKTINIGNSLKLTLSIGIGMRHASYDENNEAARKAMDLALGRGGDQAVVISDGEISYYGGKSAATAKNTRVKARVKAHAFREILDSKDQVIVMGHKNADVDALGASVGIWRIAAALGKKTWIVNGNTDASVMPFKACFNTAVGYPEDIFISGEEACKLVDPTTLLVVVDVNRPSYSEAPELIEACDSVVVIDHHRMGTETIPNPVLSYVEPYASSASEMVAELLQYIDDSDSIRLLSAEADVLYGGIVLDTQNFVVQAGVRTFEAAAFLRRKGADVVRVRKMFREKLEDYRAKAAAVDAAEVYRDCFAISVCDPEGTGSPTVIGAQAANNLLEISNIKAAIVLTPFAGKIFISARSIDEINVQVLMEKMGGGGHGAVAGAQLVGVTTEEAIEKVKLAIDEMIEKGEVK